MPGPKSDKIWADAVRRAVNRRLENAEGKPKKIEHLADKLVDLALDGDMTAVKEIGDRLDGKPHSTSDMNVKGDLTVNLIDSFADNNSK